ncbi:hypothetical protein DLJ46_03520 [Micromonospora globispora]|uniref:WD40 repeat domain-containing protein n=1 Tax=Micromonospora globispora TaxID=1450148 RepID=A0A317KFH3_9ACTN|nr:PD40 domain-containing protein [Micromonospora globispora]PWU52246.1 hypothetical protein DLJ46_03520 [Micromonospora globispora]
MNHDRLRLDLADLAGEVTPVDLRDRALRTSRRLGIQRAVATSAAAVVLLAAAAGTTLAVRPNGQAPTPAPAGPSITSSPSPVEVTPIPEPSASGPTEPTIQPSTSPAQPSSALAGTRYYLELADREAVIHAVRGDSDDVGARIPLAPDRCVANTITVSPDGKRLAWVQDTTDGMTGTLMTASTDGSGKRKLLTGVLCLGSNALVWQGGDRLMVQEGVVRSVLIDMVAGKPFDGDPGQETNRCWSADGRWLAAVSEGKPYVADENQLHSYHYDPPKDQAWKWDGWRARSVSMDGRYVSIGWVGTDPSRRDDSFTVVDTITSKVVKLPVAGTVKSIQFAADGTVLVRQGSRIVVLDSSFRRVGEVEEPQDVRAMTLLAYVP